jgi:hypothetical protein
MFRMSFERYVCEHEYRENVEREVTSRGRVLEFGRTVALSAGVGLTEIVDMIRKRLVNSVSLVDVDVLKGR